MRQEKMAEGMVEIKTDYKDFRQIVEIEELAKAKFFEAGYDPTNWTVYSEQTYREYSDRGHLWVALVDGMAVGFAI